MHLSLRPLLLATGALLLSAQHASAQFVELLLEAPVTLQGTITTTKTTMLSSTERKTVPTVTRLLHAQILEELRSSGIINDTSTVGWSLVAVTPAFADLAFVDGSFALYAVKGNVRVRVPVSKFKASNNYDGNFYGAASKYTERHLGQYVLSSKGTVTAHAAYHYQPAFTADGATFTVNESLTDGFATIAYVAKDVADGFEVFFYAPSSVRATTRGSFFGTQQFGSSPATNVNGLMTLTVMASAPKLVPATLYPDVDYYYETVSRY